MTYVLIGIVAIAGFFIASAILFGSSRLFKVTNSTYRKSMIIYISTLVSSSITAIILVFIGLGGLSQILGAIVAFFIFKQLFKRYYQASWKVALVVYTINIILGIIISTIIVIPVRRFIAEPFVVSGRSMSPTLTNGEYLIVNKYDKQYRRGDIIVFRLPDKNMYLIQRIIALPLEKITIRDGIIKINGSEFTSQNISGEIEGDLDVTLAADEFFVLGDNVEISAMDSRKIGPVKMVDIKGKVI